MAMTPYHRNKPTHAEVYMYIVVHASEALDQYTASTVPYLEYVCRGWGWFVLRPLSLNDLIHFLLGL